MLLQTPGKCYLSKSLIPSPCFLIIPPSVIVCSQSMVGVSNTPSLHPSLS